MIVKIEDSWKEKLQGEFEKPYFKNLTDFVKKEYTDSKVFPSPKNIFRAFDLCQFDKVKVVILGQDPYHEAHQANGLAFAVEEGIKLPPSLQNIFKEIQNDLGDRAKSEEVLRPVEERRRRNTELSNSECAGRSGDLSRWEKQGVLLLNSTLTVRAHFADSHQGRGWESFTDAVIAALSKERENLVFMLWGNYAKAKGAHIDRHKHLVLEAPHPSPFSAYSGFFGCKHFSKTNKYLISNGQIPIDWF